MNHKKVHGEYPHRQRVSINGLKNSYTGTGFGFRIVCMKRIVFLLLLISAPYVFAQDCADDDYKCQVQLYKDSTDANEIFSLAYAYGELKKFDESVRAWTRYIEQAPEDSKGYFNRAHDLSELKEYTR